MMYDKRFASTDEQVIFDGYRH